MFVSIQVQGQAPQSPLKEHLERRLLAAVRPFGARVAGVALRATSTVREGRTTCRVALSLDSGVYVGAAKGANVLFAAEEAVARAERAARRALREERRTALDLLGLAAVAAPRGSAA